MLEGGNRINFLNRRFNVVIDPSVTNDIVIEEDITSPPIAVAGLAYRADVAQCLPPIQAILVVDLVRTVELQILGENAGDMRVALEAIAIDQGEDAFHLALIVNVFREDIFVERIAGGAMDIENAD